MEQKAEWELKKREGMNESYKSRDSRALSLIDDFVPIENIKIFIVSDAVSLYPTHSVCNRIPTVR